jgi:serine protease inhibitor ecotin
MPETKVKVINGLSFDISQPYTEGHPCTAAEARALNQVRAENIGNNMRARIKELQAAGKNNEIFQSVAEYDAQYALTDAAVRATAVKMDPVEREARAIAKILLKEHLAKDGRKLTLSKEVSQDERDAWEEKIEQQIDKISERPDVMKAAAKRVKERQALAASIGEDIEEAA